MQKKLGVALVGMGEYSTDQLIPALRETENCYLAGIVSGDEQKRKKWKDEFDLKDENVFSYEQFDRISESSDIDIVYIVLPNSMHAEYCIRAAEAGKHIICEKPMAMNADECHRVLDACERNGVRISIGYRLHFEPLNQEMMRLGQQKIFGELKRLTLRNSRVETEPSQWRLDIERSGGGPLVNNGIYCVQAAIYITGDLPVAVSAAFATKTKPETFDEVEEGITWKMYFPNDLIADCETSYSKDQNLMRAEAEHGWFELSPAYEYEGLKGRTSEAEMELPEINQQARQMDDFAACIAENKPTRVPGEMGLRDVEILKAIYEAAKTGNRVELTLNKYADLQES